MKTAYAAEIGLREILGQLRPSRCVVSGTAFDLIGRYGNFA
jgi:hypothetical protein